MNEQHLIDLLERTADQVPDSRAPVPDVVERGRARRRRTREFVAAGALVAVVAALGAGIGLTHGSTKVPLAVRPAPLPAPPAGMKWSGIGTTVFAVPASFGMWPGLYCGGTDGHDWLTVLESNVVASCAATTGTPALPPSDVIEFRADAEGGVQARASLKHAVAGFDDQTLQASRTTLPAGWAAVPAGTLAAAGKPSADSEVAALQAAGFRTTVKQVGYWTGPTVTTSPEIGAPAPIGSVVTVYEALPLPAVAQLAGRLVEVGGPAPGAPRGVHGWVHVHSDSFDEYVYTDKHGNWSVSVPGGSPYAITGAFTRGRDGVGEEFCRASRRVTPQTEQFATSDSIEVVCSVD